MSAYPHAQSIAPTLSANYPAQPLLGAMPGLLEYRSGADPDVEYIPKAIAGFAGGAMIMGFCMNMADVLVLLAAGHHVEWIQMMATRFAFMLGITGVASSLLLVGLKVRADHTADILFARHWLNSLGTGAIYAALIWGPWILYYDEKLTINRFLVSLFFMAIMAFPAISACWIIGPERHPRAQVSAIGPQ